MLAWRGVRWTGWLLLGLLAWATWQFLLPALAFHGQRFGSGQATDGPQGLGLSEYRATIDALPVKGLVQNASGLSFNHASGTLFTVINRPPQVAEISTDGRLLRLMPLEGLRDPEGITHVRDDLFVIADERTSRLHWVRIPPDAQTVSVAEGTSFLMDLDPIRNLGFEGVSWDDLRSTLYIAKEKWPLRVMTVRGLDHQGRPSGGSLEVAEWKPSGLSALFVSDLSSLTVHEPTGSILLLSDESAMVLEYAADGTPVGMLPLWRGFHGLARKVPQPEGLAVGPDGAVYVMSEPNLFYRFARQ